MGASGRAAAGLLAAAGIELHVYDQRTPQAEDLPPDAKAFGGQEIPDAAFAGIDLMVLSPGVPPRTPRARQLVLAPEATVHGELSFALTLLQAATGDEFPPLCLITGTNGKSTITALTAHLLKAAGGRPFAGGNLGPAVSELVRSIVYEEQPLPTQLVLECSSYQLETLAPTPTKVAILSNISPDHLARYDSMAHYAGTKTAVFAGLGDEGLALLDKEDEWTVELMPEGRVRQVMSPGLEFADGQLLVEEAVFERAELRAAGQHNAKNALFALRAAIELGADAKACAEGLRSFEGLAHRMAFVREYEGVAYYNDSKATNVASVLAGLRGFERRFVLIAGGQLKGEPLDELIELVQQEGIALVAMGADRQQLVEAADKRIVCHSVESLEQAFTLAKSLVGEGEAVVLSPAGASWDQYTSFKARGDHFEKLTREL